jgi:hypothetical protein
MADEPILDQERLVCRQSVGSIGPHPARRWSCQARLGADDIPRGQPRILTRIDAQVLASRRHISAEDDPVHRPASPRGRAHAARAHQGLLVDRFRRGP